MPLITDPNDKRLGHGSDHEDDGPKPQNEVYLILSEEQRAKGFVRPVRDTYKHVGVRPKHQVRLLTVEEILELDCADDGWIAYESYPEGTKENPDGRSPGRYWTAAELESGCQGTTTMAMALAETYARDPKFYGSTYCMGCQRHARVGEFVWAGTNEVVGS